MAGIAGKYVVVTRSLRQSDIFAKKLEKHRAIPLVYPCIEILPPRDSSDLDAKIADLFAGSFDWLIFTSQNAVDSVESRIKDLGIDQQLPHTLKIAAVGSVTATAAHDAFKIKPTVVPAQFNSKELANELAVCAGQSVLIPQSAIAKKDLVQTLKASGAHVFGVQAYQTTPARGGVALVDYVEAGNVDAITFASPSAVRFFIERYKNDGGRFDALKSLCISCIGTTTQNAILDNGLKANVLPIVQTIDGMIDALNQFFLAHNT